MRVTTQTKQQTRDRIVVIADEAFSKAGWNRVTTKAISSEAGIAAGTLFNYFSSKEDLACELLLSGVRAGEREYRAQRRGDELMEEDLFAFIWSGFRKLEPYRAMLAEAHQRLFSPLAKPAQHPGDALRSLQIEGLGLIAGEHGVANTLTPVLVQLYWTLYLGVLAHWAADESPHQEDSLALLDQSLIVFCAALTPSQDNAGHHAHADIDK